MTDRPWWALLRAFKGLLGRSHHLNAAPPYSRLSSARGRPLGGLILALVVASVSLHLGLASTGGSARWQLLEFMPLARTQTVVPPEAFGAGDGASVSINYLERLGAEGLPALAQPRLPLADLPAGALDLRQAPAPLLPSYMPGREPVTLLVHQDGSTFRLATTRTTVGGALASGSFVVGPYDAVSPSLSTLVRPGLHVSIRPALRVYINDGGSTVALRTPAATVAQALEEAGVSLGQLDRVEPALTALVGDGMRIAVTRILETVITQEEAVPHAVVYRDGPGLEVGQTVVLKPGQDGVRYQQVRVTYEDGREVRREPGDSWLGREPEPKVVARGVRPPVRTVQTPSGLIRYTRTVIVYATWYNASHGGKSPGDPVYGLTVTGQRVEKGFVAVDPSVIPLGTRLYIPGYGIAVAADTGGGVIGYHIDLAYPEGVVPDWPTGLVTIYILPP